MLTVKCKKIKIGKTNAKFLKFIKPKLNFLIKYEVYDYDLYTTPEPTEVCWEAHQLAHIHFNNRHFVTLE